MQDKTSIEPGVLPSNCYDARLSGGCFGITLGSGASPELSISGDDETRLSVGSGWLHVDPLIRASVQAPSPESFGLRKK